MFNETTLFNELYDFTIVYQFDKSDLPLKYLLLIKKVIMKMYESFNQSGFSIFLNSMSGRILRIVVGIVFLVVGFIYREHTGGVISILWGILPLSAGAFDICYVSAALGGPLSGKRIRSKE